MAGQFPDWVREGKETPELLAWLESEKDVMEVFAKQTLLKARSKNCVLIYSQGGEGKETGFHSIRLCGIFRKTDRALYEVTRELYQAAGIPETFCFPDKEEVQKEVERKVTEAGRKKMLEEWDELVLKSGFTREQMIPAIDREQIRMTAKRYFQMGKRAADIDYQPRFSFASISLPFRDEAFLWYLEDGKAMVAAAVKVWLAHGLADISKKRIYFGCVKEEMADMEKSGYLGKPDNRSHVDTQQTYKKTA